MKAGVLIALTFIVMSPCYAGDRVLVQVPAVLDPQVAFSDVVRRECPVQSLLGNQVFRMVSMKFPRSLQIEKPEGTEKDTVLTLTILRIVAAEGGFASGPKSLSVRADLVQSGKVIATMEKERVSGFGSRWGTCALLEHAAALFGRDIANWLPIVLGGQVPTEPR